MGGAAGSVAPLDEKRRRQHDLLARLREIDHWRRLVAARLDLAVAALTAVQEPRTSAGAGDDVLDAPVLPPDLREILGLPDCHAALPEAALLLRLRETQRELDAYARHLREATDLATLELATLMDAERAERTSGDAASAHVTAGNRSRRRGHLRVVTDDHEQCSSSTDGTGEES